MLAKSLVITIQRGKVALETKFRPCQKSKLLWKDFQLPAITRPEDKGCGYSSACLDNFYLPEVWKLFKIMTVDNTRNPPIWQAVYYHTLGNLGTVLSWWSEKSFYCRAALRCFLSKISFFFFRNLKRLISNWAVYTFQAVDYQETQSEELVLDNQLLLA